MADDKPFTITVYGTPAEESIGGKIVMQKNGCFEELDVALMFHAGQTTTTDIKSLALSSFKVRFHGRSAHAAMAPEEGRSALDGLMLAFQGVEYMREHVREDTRMHYTITNGGGADNVVPALAEGTVTLRSYNRAYLDTVVERLRDIIAGAGLMSGTQGELVEDLPFDSKIPVLRLNQLLMEKAQALNAPPSARPGKTGSTDFGNVMYRVPGLLYPGCLCAGALRSPQHGICPGRKKRRNASGVAHCRQGSGGGLWRHAGTAGTVNGNS